MAFPKIYLGKFCQKFFSVISVNYCLRHHFLIKVILVELKILYTLIQWSKRFIFWNIFLYCKIINSFIELFLVTCFLCIFQTQLLFWYFFLFWIYFSPCMQVWMYNCSLLSVFPLSSSWEIKIQKNKVADWTCKIHITLFFQTSNLS